jgi:hypothetical protein
MPAFPPENTGKPIHPMRINMIIESPPHAGPRRSPDRMANIFWMTTGTGLPGIGIAMKAPAQHNAANRQVSEARSKRDEL